MALALEFVVAFLAVLGFLVSARHALFAFAYLIVLTALLVRRRGRASGGAAGPRPSFRDSTSFFDRERALRDVAHTTGYLVISLAMLVAVGAQLALGLFIQPQVEGGRTPEGRAEVTAALMLGPLEVGKVQAVGGPEPGAASCTRYQLPFVRASGGLAAQGPGASPGPVLEWQFRFGLPHVRSWSGAATLVVEKEEPPSPPPPAPPAPSGAAE